MSKFAARFVLPLFALVASFLSFGASAFSWVEPSQSYQCTSSSCGGLSAAQMAQTTTDSRCWVRSVPLCNGACCRLSFLVTNSCPGGYSVQLNPGGGPEGESAKCVKTDCADSPYSPGCYLPLVSGNPYQTTPAIPDYSCDASKSCMSSSWGALITEICQVKHWACNGTCCTVPATMSLSCPAEGGWELYGSICERCAVGYKLVNHGCVVSDGVCTLK